MARHYTQETSKATHPTLDPIFVVSTFLRWKVIYTSEATCLKSIWLAVLETEPCEKLTGIERRLSTLVFHHFEQEPKQKSIF